MTACRGSKVFLPALLLTVAAAAAMAAPPALPRKLLPKPGLYKALTEPPCSYCSTQHRSGLVRMDDRAVAWLRAAHHGGAIPIRHFLAAPRVINDTYGLFFYDPDGGYVSAFKKDYGYEFYGWRGAVMVVRSADGTLWSALSGVAFDGPQKGKRLVRIPSIVTDWGYWLMLHPESTAYNLFGGKKYPTAELPAHMSAEARQTMGSVDPRRPPSSPVLGVEFRAGVRAYPLDALEERACITDTVGDETVAIFWYGPTETAVAFRPEIDGRPLTFFADADSPETAPFKDRETGTRWSLAGRGIEGPLKGKELSWISSIQCRWYAWTAEYPETSLYAPRK
jgi:hypothetical protein